jgi:hypothetical protein
MNFFRSCCLARARISLADLICVPRKTSAHQSGASRASTHTGRGLASQAPPGTQMQAHSAAYRGRQIHRHRDGRRLPREALSTQTPKQEAQRVYHTSPESPSSQLSAAAHQQARQQPHAEHEGARTRARGAFSPIRGQAHTTSLAVANATHTPTHPAHPPPSRSLAPHRPTTLPCRRCNARRGNGRRYYRVHQGERRHLSPRRTDRYKLEDISRCLK